MHYLTYVSSCVGSDFLSFFTIIQAPPPMSYTVGPGVPDYDAPTFLPQFFPSLFHSPLFTPLMFVLCGESESESSDYHCAVVY
jgi:hypothetical protein